MTKSTLSPSETTARKIAFVLGNATEALADDAKHPGYAVLKVQRAEDVIPPLLDEKILTEDSLLGVRVDKTPVMRTERVENGGWYRNEADTLCPDYDEKEYVDHYDISVAFTGGKRKSDAFVAEGKLYLNTEAVNDVTLDRQVDNAISRMDYSSSRADVTKLAGPEKGQLQKLFNAASKIRDDFTIEKAADPAFGKKLKEFLDDVDAAGVNSGVTEIIGKKNYRKLVSAETRLRL